MREIRIPVNIDTQVGMHRIEGYNPVLVSSGYGAHLAWVTENSSTGDVLARFGFNQRGYVNELKVSYGYRWAGGMTLGRRARPFFRVLVGDREDEFPILPVREWMSGYCMSTVIPSATDVPNYVSSITAVVDGATGFLGTNIPIAFDALGVTVVTPRPGSSVFIMPILVKNPLNLVASRIAAGIVQGATRDHIPADQGEIVANGFNIDTSAVRESHIILPVTQPWNQLIAVSFPAGLADNPAVFFTGYH
jgi:hypothetical protein